MPINPYSQSVWWLEMDYVKHILPTENLQESCFDIV